MVPHAAETSPPAQSASAYVSQQGAGVADAVGDKLGDNVEEALGVEVTAAD